MTRFQTFLAVLVLVGGSFFCPSAVAQTVNGVVVPWGAAQRQMYQTLQTQGDMLGRQSQTLQSLNQDIKQLQQATPTTHATFMSCSHPLGQGAWFMNYSHPAGQGAWFMNHYGGNPQTSR